MRQETKYKEPAHHPIGVVGGHRRRLAVNLMAGVSPHLTPRRCRGDARGGRRFALLSGASRSEGEGCVAPAAADPALTDRIRLARTRRLGCPPLRHRQLKNSRALARTFLGAAQLKNSAPAHQIQF